MTANENADNYDVIYKIVLVGDSGVGKTNMMLRYLNKEFNKDSKATVGVEFGAKNTTIEGKIVKGQIWDTAGQERYRAITSAYYKGAKGAFVVYDISQRETFDSVDRWISELRSNTDERMVILLIGNKSDLEDKRAVKKEEGEDKARENEIAFLETSALTTDNIEKAFNEILNKVYEAYKTFCEVELSKEAVTKTLFGMRMKNYGYISKVRSVIHGKTKVSKRYYVKKKKSVSL